MRWLALGLVACGVPDTIPKEDFAEAAARVICARSRECALGQFDAAYFGMADCRAEYEQDFQQLVELNDSLNCEYDATEAAKAWVETNEMSCENFYEGDYLTAADQIWGDCGGFGTTITGYYDQ